MIRLGVRCGSHQAGVAQVSALQAREGAQTLQVKYITWEHNVVQLSTVQYISTLQYCTVQYGSVQFRIVQCSSVQFRIVQYRTV